MANNPKIEICESYKDFLPPSWVHRSVTRLIDGVPEKYCGGLHSVTLTNTDGLNHSRRRQKTISRKRKISVIECRGLYHQKWQGKPATIELFVDKIIHRWPVIVLKVPLVQDLLLADVLYHELGHHVHKTCAPEHREREDVAEDWQKKLVRHYFRQNYKWIKPFKIILKPIVALPLKIVRLIQRKAKHKEMN
ncbi:MAG: hypothetical protein C4560_01235 [Nitrospiraceae bacterium]|nr:MAG: hypothetical protein C4560_01235 [Nitrospiraceae bacterium]